MTSKIYSVSDLDELNVLHRVFREAKFCIEADDVEISDSPIVARMFARLVETIIAAEVDREGDGARTRWESWLNIDESRDEWMVAISRIHRSSEWASFSDQERREYATTLLSPFRLSSETLARFINSAAEKSRTNRD